MAPLDPTDLVDLYWAGRATLRHPARGQVADLPPDVPSLLPRRRHDASPSRSCCAPSRRAEAAGGAARCRRPSRPERGRRSSRSLGWWRPTRTSLKHKIFAACTPEELAALRRIMRGCGSPRRGAAPGAPAGRRGGGEPDMRAHGPRVDAAARRAAGAAVPPAPAAAAAADPDPRRVRLDGRLLAQPGAVRAHLDPRADARVEVFCFGTRLTRITRELDRRRPDHALDARGRGGPRLGGRHPDRRVARRRSSATGPGAGCAAAAIVVICSDGLDRGDPSVLASGDGAAVAAVPPDRLAEPAQGRRAATSGPTRWA